MNTPSKNGKQILDKTDKTVDTTAFSQDISVNFAALLNAAKQARERAYAPYSGFAVGAAILAKNGDIYTGCNIENASFPLTNCAERTALFTAVAAGVRGFTAIAIAGGKQGEPAVSPCPPCGACRQVMREFCGDAFAIITDDGQGGYRVHTLAELLPESFSNTALNA